MIIPTQFKLFGQTIHVSVDPTLLKRENDGEALFLENKILLTSEAKPKELIDETFCHELMHFILEKGTSHNTEKYKLKDGTDLCFDEELVTLTSVLLHQALTTQTGELNYKNWK